jgi:hypothetical protein
MRNTSRLFSILLLAGLSIAIFSCDDDDNGSPQPAASFEQEDQMGRPGISTVFVGTNDRDIFNTTVPSELGAAFAGKFNDQLMALNPGYTTNLLTLDAATFSGALATDVLSVSLDAPTTYFDGTNVLTGRKLDDDVIDVSLILIFGGPDGSENPGLTSDNVDANDKAFSSSFPYLAAPH